MSLLRDAGRSVRLIYLGHAAVRLSPAGYGKLNQPRHARCREPGGVCQSNANKFGKVSARGQIEYRCGGDEGRFIAFVSRGTV